jgi:putative Mn2+ efflux pump MntP
MDAATHKPFKTDKANQYFEFSLYLVTSACLVYYSIYGIYAKVFQTILILVVLTLVRGLVKFTKTDLFPALRFSILFFIALTMLFANAFGFYGLIPYLDKIEHLISGVILSFLGLIVFNKISKTESTPSSSSSIAIWFSLFFSAALAGCWEIYEFATDHLFGLNSQNNSLSDSMTDIICGLIGAVMATIYLMRSNK